MSPKVLSPDLEVPSAELRKEAYELALSVWDMMPWVDFIEEQVLAIRFADAEHYRRDRRKDFLLQKNGYLVLRFLAEDVTRRLSQVIDEIAAAIEARRGP